VGIDAGDEPGVPKGTYSEMSRRPGFNPFLFEPNLAPSTQIMSD